ncbi:hypothetical protein [Veillonella parvula]|uniref:hypothetical protein n=2 Tax=Veillonella parvula TaxID=29466 RepID=UPI003991BF45
MSRIIQLLTFIWYSMTTDLYTQYRSYIKQQLMNKSNSELQIIHELLVSDFESRYMFIWGTISLGAILALIVSIGSNLAIEVLKEGASESIIFAYSQFIIITIIVLLGCSIVGFVSTMFLSISKFKSIGFYGILFVGIIGLVYWSHFEHSILMDLFFLILSCICTGIMFATIFDTIKNVLLSRN